MRVNDEAEMIVSLRRRGNEVAKLTLDAGGPIGLISDVAALEMRDKIECLIAAGFEVVERVHEGADANCDWARATPVVEQLFAHAHVLEGLAVESGASLCMQLCDHVIIKEALCTENLIRVDDVTESLKLAE